MTYVIWTFPVLYHYETIDSHNETTNEIPAEGLRVTKATEGMQVDSRPSAYAL